MERDYTTEIEIEDVKLRIEYSYEDFDRREYDLTGYGGGIELYSIKLVEKDADLSGLLMRNNMYAIIEETVLEQHEDRYE